MSPAAVLERFQSELLLTEQGQAAWEKVFSYDFSTVRAKLLKEQAVPEDRVDSAIDEYRKFLALMLLGFRGLAMTSRDVDEVWHTHILFTRDYMAFTKEVFGRYLHHQPGTDEAPIPVDAGPHFRNAYGEVFGELHPIWLGSKKHDHTNCCGRCSESTGVHVVNSKCTVDCQSRCSGDCSGNYCTND